MLINLPSDNTNFYDVVESVDDIAEVQSEDEIPDLELKAKDEFWGHCSNLQAWAENNYDTHLLHSNLAFPLLKKLVDAGDKLAKAVFKEEVMERLMDGNLNTILFILDQGYLDKFLKEERDAILEDFRSHLESVINDVLEDDRKFKFLDFHYVKQFKEQDWASNAEQLYLHKFIHFVKSGDEEDFERVLCEDVINEYGYREDSLYKILSNTSLAFLEYLIKIMMEEVNIVIYLGYEEIDLVSNAKRYFHYIRELPPSMLNKWLIDILPELNKKLFLFLLRKCFFKQLTYKDLGPFLNDSQFNFLSEYFVQFENEIFFIEENSTFKDDYENQYSTLSMNWLYHCVFGGASVTIKNKSIKNISQIQGLERIKNLQYLDLQGNEITEISKLRNLQKLRKLFLSNNQIQTLQDFTQFPDLKVLDLRNNKVSNTEGLSQLKNLHTLYLDNNRITELEIKEVLPKLSLLSLKGNKIESISGVENLPNVETSRLRI